MSQVHPSRAGFVPQERPRATDYHDSERLERETDNRRSRSPQRAHDNDDNSSRYRRPSPSYDNYRGGQDRSRQGAEQDEEQRRREAWMRGDDLRRNGGSTGGAARRHTPERELQQRNGDGGYGQRGGGYGRGGPPQRGGADFFEARRQERDNSTVTIWAESPRSPLRSPSPEGRKSSSRKHKSSRRRKDYSSSSSDSDSDDSRRRSSSKKHKSSSSRKHHRHHEKSSRHRSSRKYSDEDGDSDDEDRRHGRHRSSHRDRSDDERESARRKEDSHRSSRRRSESRDVESSSKAVARRDDHGDDEDDWVEKPSAVALDDADEVGPMPVNMQNQKMARGAYGGALLRGEGDAMAAYVQEGVRIPRRGEIGLESEQIERFEAAGYVMSGSRHRRMNAVRVRKENQVISAEEKRGILKLQAEEKAKRENEIVASFREMVSQKLSGPSGGA
ncbi:hypothetical protein ACM66B_004456 [Microbotryomycetes sp. NB124-2]